jgi:hypothetical protein
MYASFTETAGLAKRDGVRRVANKQSYYDVFHADSMKRFGWIVSVRSYYEDIPWQVQSVRYLPILL